MRKYQNLSEEEKEKGLKGPETTNKIFLKKKKKRQYHRESNKTFSEEEKQKQVQYK